MTGRVDYAAVQEAASHHITQIASELWPDGTQPDDDVIAAVAKAQGVEYDEAANWLANRYRMNGALTSSQHVPQPLYGLDTLDRTGKVLIVRDMECAAVARRMFPRSPVLWFEGPPKLLSWPDLKDRPVIAWLDGSQAGALRSVLPALMIVDYPPTVPRTWNIAQAESEGWGVKRIAEFIRNNTLTADIWAAGEAAAFSAAVPELPEEEPAPPPVEEPVPAPTPAAVVAPVTVMDLLDRYVYIVSGRMVGDLQHPERIMPIRDFEGMYAAHSALHAGRITPVTKMWMTHLSRSTVDSVVFAPDSPRVCRVSRGGKAQFNLYDPPTWPAEAATSPQPFIDHMEYLIPDEKQRNDLLDWLAHLLQRPAQRPHRHFLLYAQQEGTGRSWLGNLMRALLAPHAEHCDITQILNSDFNGKLSGKLLLTVDEVQAPAHDRFAQRNRLKSLLTAEHITINQKYLSPWEERFYCRFLMFTNRVDALPLSETDRRIEAIDCATKLQPQSYYQELYRLKDHDKSFLCAVYWYLMGRDISRFYVGGRAGTSALKEEMIDETRSEEVNLMIAVIKACPYHAVAGADLLQLCVPREDRETKGSYASRKIIASRTLREAGFTRSRRSVMIDGRNTRLWLTTHADDLTQHKVLNDDARKARSDFDRLEWNADLVWETWKAKAPTT